MCLLILYSDVCNLLDFYFFLLGATLKTVVNSLSDGLVKIACPKCIKQNCFVTENVSTVSTQQSTSMKGNKKYDEKIEMLNYNIV